MMSDDISIEAKYFECVTEEDKIISDQIMEKFKQLGGSQQVTMPTGSTLPRFNTPATVNGLLNLPELEELDTWLLIKRGADFAEALKDKGKTVYTADKYGTITGPDGKRYPMSRYNRLKELFAGTLFECIYFSRDYEFINAFTDKKVFTILERLIAAKKMCAEEKLTFSMCVTDMLQETFMPFGKLMIHTSAALTAPHGSIERGHNFDKEQENAEKKT